MNDYTASIYFVILVCLLSTVHLTITPAQNSSTTTKGLGKAVCGWYGGTEQLCNFTEVTFDKVPEQCTSLLYSGIRIDLHGQVTDYHPDQGTNGILDKLIATKKNVMMFFGHSDQLEWITALNVSADWIQKVAEDEMQSVKAYVDQHEGIAGMIIINLERHELHGLSENLKTYIGVMRNTFPEMEIGLNLDSYAPVFYIEHPQSKWLDFKLLNQSFDFYVLNLLDINNCTDELVDTGVFPLTGDDGINSIDKIVNYLEGVGVPICDLYYTFQPYGTLRGANPADSTDCSLFYPNICTEKVKSKDNKDICADTLQSLYAKGQYARARGKGFTTDIDVDDTQGICNCNLSFPVFYALLAGFNGRALPPDCHLFNRN